MPHCKRCGYSTEDTEEFLRHLIDERLKNEPKEERKRHKTVDEFLDCPDCFPKFEKAFLERGYVKKKEIPREEI